jgi:AcrR family transcriptional regulator
LAKVPHQARAVETVHAILDTAARVLAEGDADAFSTAHVAAAGGVGPGTMYQYFANREMLLAALLEREMLEAELLVRAALAPPRQGPLAELLSDVLAALAVHFESHAGLVSRITAISPALAQDAVADVLEPRLMDAIHDHLVRDPSHSQLLTDSPSLYVAVNGALFVLFKWLADRPPQISRGDLVAALAEQTREILGLDGAGPAPPRP